MPVNKEISALLHLIDDPDQEVFDTVANKIMHYGIKIIPSLESLWEETPDEKVQQRIEMLIHRVHYQNLQTDFKEWINEEEPDLFEGSLLVARYRYPGLNINSLVYELDKIKRNIWLELNNYLTSLERTNVLNSMIYSYFNMKGAEVSYSRANQFYINNVIESRKGNSISVGILYQMLCAQLDIPIYAVNIPKQYILGYFTHPVDFTLPETVHQQDIQFFIDPLQGQIYTVKDIEVYLKKMNIPLKDFYFKPLSNKSIIRLLLTELSKCYENKKDLYRSEELLSLADLLRNETKG